MSCLKTSFTVFSRTDYELELSSRRVAGRTRVGWTSSKMRTRPHQLRRVAISSLLRSGISKPAESEDYVLKSHTSPSALSCLGTSCTPLARHCALAIVRLDIPRPEMSSGNIDCSPPRDVLAIGRLAGQAAVKDANESVAESAKSLVMSLPAAAQ